MTATIAPLPTSARRATTAVAATHTSTNVHANSNHHSAAALREKVRAFAVASDARALFHIASTFAVYVALLAAMAWSLRLPYVVTVALAIPTGGTMVRLFVLFHDCCHLSLFKTRRANEIAGTILSPFVLTSYFHWRLEHSHHHATSGNLDKRGIGDVPTMLASEYAKASPLKRFGYRVVRNPLFLFTIGATVTFVLLQRFWGPFASTKEKVSVVGTNVAVFLLYGAAVVLFGAHAVFFVLAPVFVIAATGGVWLFFVQHQFPGSYWRREADWSYDDAALHGSSFYDLPQPLRWFSGNIGYHHIHHLNPRVPLYRLPACHRAVTAHVQPLTIRASLRCVALHLVDDVTLAPISFPR